MPFVLSRCEGRTGLEAGRLGQHRGESLIGTCSLHVGWPIVDLERIKPRTMRSLLAMCFVPSLLLPNTQTWSLVPLPPSLHLPPPSLSVPPPSLLLPLSPSSPPPFLFSETPFFPIIITSVTTCKLISLKVLGRQHKHWISTRPKWIITSKTL